MDRNSVIGVAGVFVVIIVSILLIGDIFSYVSVTSFLITILGAFLAMLASKKSENIRVLPSLILLFFRQTEIDFKKNMITMISFSEKARREGLLALEDDVEIMEDLFFKGAIRLVIDGTDPEVVKQILSKEIDSLEERHTSHQSMISYLAELSPAYGLIGTLIGLIGVLGEIGGDIVILGQQMSVALITTLYGVIMANGVWGPMLKKLEKKTEEEVFSKKVILEGILSLQFGDNPRILEQKLMSFFSYGDRDELKNKEEI